MFYHPEHRYQLWRKKCLGNFPLPAKLLEEAPRLSGLEKAVDFYCARLDYSSYYILDSLRGRTITIGTFYTIINKSVALTK
jgi:hypothetical protein